MAASATVDSSYEAMIESFLLSNTTPQLPGLNRQGWRYLELNSPILMNTNQIMGYVKTKL